MTAAVRKMSARDQAKTYELSLVKGYVSRWGMVQAVRELIQNALDSASPFDYEFLDHGEGSHELRLTSVNAVLTPQTLLLGVTTKANDREAIGSFGEGYKIAMLVLTRLGYDVEIWNGCLVWKPRFRFSRAFGDELLVVDEVSRNDERAPRGVTFIVRRLGDDDVQQIKDSCLLMQDSVGAVRQTKYGDILMDQPGRLYVGGLFICETQLRFGYNIKPEHITLERDRNTVSEWDLKWHAKECWFDTGDTELIAKLIEENAPDMEHAAHGTPDAVKEACYAMFKKTHPGGMIARSQYEVRDMAERGITNIVCLENAYGAVVSSSPSYFAARPPVERRVETPTEILRRFLRENRVHMRRPAIVALKALISMTSKWKGLP